MTPLRQFANVYAGRTVMVTGHTGFKGSWLALWLTELGAQVVGYALPPPTQPNHFDLLGLPMTSIVGDVRDPAHLRNVLATHRPSVIFHLAAQPLVRPSYREAEETFATNIQGTINLYETCRTTPEVQAIVTITTDKCYENRESPTGYRETDPLGGSDPYSCSKACVELITACYRQSFFAGGNHDGGHQTLLASARAGNVIGGGDWAEDRLVPDAVKAAARGEAVLVRNPSAVRPWQHVLEPLAGYLLLGQRLVEGKTEFAQAWNFGPDDEGAVAVEQVIARLQQAWPRICVQTATAVAGPHETQVLKLDASKARTVLDWRPQWRWQEAVERTARWYRQYYENGAVATRDDLECYVRGAGKQGFVWCG